MISYRDKTFCVSPNCKNRCGRQLTEFDKAESVRVGLPLCTAWFCGAPEGNKKK